MWASPVSVPASPPTTWGQPHTSASPVSVPESRLPDIIICLPLVTTEWTPLPVASYYLLSSKFLPGLHIFFYLLPPGATMPLYCDHPPPSPYRQRILQILVATIPTAPRLPIFSLYRSSPNVFPSLLALIMPQASPTSRQLAVALVSPQTFGENMCVFPLPSVPFPLTVPTSPIQTVVPFVPPTCRTFRTPWVTPLPILAVPPTSPRPTLRACYFALPMANHNVFGIGFSPDI